MSGTTRRALGNWFWKSEVKEMAFGKRWFEVLNPIKAFKTIALNFFAGSSEHLRTCVSKSTQWQPTRELFCHESRSLLCFDSITMDTTTSMQVQNKLISQFIQMPSGRAPLLTSHGCKISRELLVTFITIKLLTSQLNK